MSDQVAIMARSSELEAVLVIGGTLLFVFVTCLLGDIIAEHLAAWRAGRPRTAKKETT